MSRCRPGRKLWVTQASREVTKTGAGPHQPRGARDLLPTAAEGLLCGDRRVQEEVGVWWLGHAPHPPPPRPHCHWTLTRPGRQLSLCAPAQGARVPGGAALLLNARQAWQSPRETAPGPGSWQPDTAKEGHIAGYTHGSLRT